MKRFIACILGAILAVLSIVPTRASTFTQARRNQALAHEIAEIMRANGHEEDHPVIKACQEWWQEENQAEYETVVYTTMEQRAKYPVASAIWQMLREIEIGRASCRERV